MEIKDLVGQVEALGGQVKESIATAEKNISKNVDDKIKSATEEITEKSEASVKVVKDEVDNLKEKVKEMSSKSRTSGMFGEQSKVFGEQLAEAIEAKNTAEPRALKSKQPFALNLDTKAVGDITAANFTGSATAAFIPPQVRSGLILNPTEPVRLRQILPIGATTSPKIVYARENGGEGGPGMVAPGGLKTQMDFDLTKEEADVRKIAGHIRIHEEMLEDIPYLTSYLTRKGTEKVLDLEDSQIFYGDGTGDNLEGLFTSATPFDFPEGHTVGAANRYDVLRAARLMARRANRSLSVHLVSPLDYFLMTSTKETTGGYLFRDGLLTIDGVPVFEHSKITDGDFLSMDRNSAEIAFRKGIEVRFFEQDRDNAIRNMVTIVIEERLALPIYEPGGIIKGTFAAAISDLGSAV